ncbi:O-antigen ligase family protein [soil metagenome]
MLLSNRSLDRGRVLAGIGGISLFIFYGLFTLSPNSNSLMVKWPWVLGWQLGLALGPVALIVQLWQQKSLIRLGDKLDWLAGGWLLCLALNVGFASFVHQAGWYAWAVVCAIAILYTLTQWLTSSIRVSRLLHFQGALAIAFAVLSLTLWIAQTALPYLDTLASLKSYGISRSFDWQIVSLRNWYPIGHQNYVAGYLILSLPLLLGLSILHKGQQRVLWGAGFLVGLVCLYTTASRGSWFGLLTSAAALVIVFAWRYPQRRKLLSIATLMGTGGLLFWIFGNDRLRTLLLSAFTGSNNNEIAYRVVTNTTGWLIGRDHWLFGAGLGNVALLYQKYLPDWAGQSAELTYQLHSTPAQIWAEFGLTGSLLALGSFCLLACLSLRWFRSGQYSPDTFVLVASLWSGLLGYGVFSLSDYQLDNLCISGTLVIFIAVLAFYLRAGLETQPSYTVRRLPVAVLGISLLVVVSVWLYPIHRAWMLSSQGFTRLAQADTAGFVDKLEDAHRLAPWEPYYPYQLGWNLGGRAYLTSDVRQREMLQALSTEWLEKAIAISPYQEFGYSNLGWLLVNTQPERAVAAFSQAAQLVPSKKGSFFALGYALLQSNRLDLAIEAITLELLRNPLLLTSPIWRSPELEAIFPQVLSAFEQTCTRFINESSAELKPYFYQIRGGLHWWRGNFDQARADFSHTSNPLNSIMLSLGTETPVSLLAPSSPAEAAAMGWLDAGKKESAFYKALLLSNPSEYAYPESYLAQMSQEIAQGAEKSASFHQWLTEMAPVRSQRNQRLGFGVLSRHIDGPLPSDFAPRLENVLMTQFFGDLFPAEIYNPGLDQLLAPLREQLINQTE